MTTDTKKTPEERLSEADAEHAALEVEAKVLEQKLQILTTQKQIADLQRDPATDPVKQAEQATAYANAAKALLPTGLPTVTPLDGSVDIDEKAGYTVELLAYHALDEGTKYIAKTVLKALAAEVKDRNSEVKILVTTERNLAQASVLRIQVQEHLETLTKVVTQQLQLNQRLLNKTSTQQFSFVSPATIGAALQFGVGAFGVLASLASYFQTNYSIKGRTFTLSNDAFSTSVVGAILREDAGGLKKPSLYLQNFYEVITASIIKQLESFVMLTETLRESRNELSEFLVSTVRNKAAAATKALDQTDALLKTSQEYIASITKPGESGAPSTLILAALNDNTAQLGITHVLYVNVVSSGGQIVTRKSLWPKGKSPITYVAGSIASYVLAEVDGKVISADTIYELKQLDEQFNGAVEEIISMVKGS